MAALCCKITGDTHNLMRPLRYCAPLGIVLPLVPKRELQCCRFILAHVPLTHAHQCPTNVLQDHRGNTRHSLQSRQDQRLISSAIQSTWCMYNSCSSTAALCCKITGDTHNLMCSLRYC
eukprot:1160685-Pelagomonas_calceolata.AAC.2